MNDEDLVGRVRAAVHGEAGATDDALADRLLHGTAQRRRARSTGTLALAAVVLAGAGLGGATLRAGSDDHALKIDSASEAPGVRQAPSQARAVTVEQAARKGVDGTAACNAYAANNADGATGITPRLSLYAAYLTDFDGYEQWSQEYTGADTKFRTIEPSGQIIALCWYSGDIAKDLSAGRAALPPTHQLVAIHVSGPMGMRAPRLDSRGPLPIPVLAPPVPAGTPADAPLRSFPQPASVAILDELPLQPPPPPPTDPAACLPSACADPTQEAIVKVEPTIDGEPVDPFGYRMLAPGHTVMVRLQVDVEAGQMITNVSFGLSGDNGFGGNSPEGEVFAAAPTITGSRTFETSWTVPQLDKGQQLVFSYGEKKFPKDYPEGVGHARTLGGVTVPGAAPAH